MNISSQMPMKHKWCLYSHAAPPSNSSLISACLLFSCLTFCQQSKFTILLNMNLPLPSQGSCLCFTSSLESAIQELHLQPFTVLSMPLKHNFLENYINQDKVTLEALSPPSHIKKSLKKAVLFAQICNYADKAISVHEWLYCIMYKDSI